ncbi:MULTISPECIES: class I SAM-dependent methyltransferase [Mycobacteriaceae]|jgi:methyltransferase (TIGR00027 family)|uniref:S-adenosyl-L-methionine-dependent methyltransferase n=2 Tax=Mycolicibacterium TaxID=1866885 RepID=A0A7I7ZUJ9_9MYCO|nr:MULTISPECIES: class I SAM-dependent methyltransferase [Mycolicibacterium]OBA88831.1 SAM-dependent methyltransferase [Mycolicibacterium mucogenicum]TLH63758.1 class I SAM-dependent methyltransferase [Mycolicibacterium phocaicum]BBZ57898.1 putative S-adenosyl-L-methionine-dependent methyltransferase [Mycolicibacterium phocaicum]BCI79969.1 putative S-adenosyl-L-methionine-dependent methyltransferase [Mycolicibacterium sp. TY66]BCJ82365.1 putative S-adenosyl-L-methionine-dependent methyltransfe
MTRTDSDTWDLASSVGATATMVATARALATKEAEPLIRDPYADPLVRAVGVEFFIKLLDGQVDLSGEVGTAAAMMTNLMAVRTKFFDDFFTTAGDAGIRQAVILAAGLDSRAYRLDWPAGTVVYEIDQPEVIAAKTGTMAQIGATPTCERRTVAIDLREDWPAALRAAGFDPSAPTAWIAEGLLIYLPPEAQDKLFDNITALSAPGSRLATEFHTDHGAGMRERGAAMSERWRGAGLDLNLTDLWYQGERTSVVEHLDASGWNTTARPRLEVFAEYGRPLAETEDTAALRNSLSVTATKN